MQGMYYGTIVFSQVWRVGERWRKQSWLSQPSHPPHALSLGSLQSTTEQLKNLGSIAKYKITLIANDAEENAGGKEE